MQKFCDGEICNKHNEGMTRRSFLKRTGSPLGAAAVLGFLGKGDTWPDMLLPLASASGVLLEKVDYTFVYPDPSGRNSEPDPAMWNASGTIAPQAEPGVGLVIVDPEHTSGSSLIYFHLTPYLTGDSTSLHYRNTATFFATVMVPPVNEGSGAWANNAIGWRMVLDDGARRAELSLARVAGSNARVVRLEDAPNAAAIPFTWDDAMTHTVLVTRLEDGSFFLSIDGQSGSYQAAQLPASSGSPCFKWGMGVAGGGVSVWQEVHAEVRSEAFPISIDIKPGSFHNSISLRDHGILPVAILGTSSFDVARINLETIELGGVDIATRGSAKTKKHVKGKAPKLAYSFEDVNSDGIMDLMAFFKVQALVNAGALTETTTALTLTANLKDGTPIQGTDSVNVVS